MEADLRRVVNSDLQAVVAQGYSPTELHEEQEREIRELQASIRAEEEALALLTAQAKASKESGQQGSYNSDQGNDLVALLLWKTRAATVQDATSDEEDGTNFGGSEALPKSSTSTRDVNFAEFSHVAALSGILFTHSINLLVSGGLRKFVVHGSARTLAFELTFHVREADLTVVDMAASYPHVSQPDLDVLLTRCRENGCSLRMFFKGLSRYAELREERARIFTELEKSQSGWFVCPNGPTASTVAVLGKAPTPKAQPALSFVFVWDISFDKDGSLTQTQTLHPRAAWNVLTQSEVGVTRSTPTVFADLVHLKGLVGALEIMIELLKGGSSN